MSGWLKISRDICNHWIWKDPIKFQWWIDILLTVNYADSKVLIGFKVFECKRGETLLSLSSWSKRWGVSKSVVNNFFTMLKNENMIETKNETVTIRLTVCNYDKYQIFENANETQDKRKRNARQTQDDTIKEREEKKEEKEDIVARDEKFISDISEYKEKYHKDILNSFYLYWSEKTPNGDKMKFELQKTFEISKRLATWFSNNNKFGNNKIKPQPLEKQFSLKNYDIPHSDLFGYTNNDLIQRCKDGLYKEIQP